MWPYQTMCQTQNFLVEEFPDKGKEAPFVMMIFATWPMFLTHTFLSVTGLSRRLSYPVKLTVPSVIVVLLAVYLVIVLRCSSDADLLLRSLYSAALIGSIAESFVEPAVYDMAGLLPSTSTSQMVQAGNGACGLVVSVVQMSTRLLTNGTGRIDKNHLEVLTMSFIALMGATSLAIVAIYWSRVRRCDYYIEYVQQPPVSQDIDSFNPSSRDEIEEEDKGNENVFKAMIEAFRYVWPSFLAVALTFVVTLSLWPVIPGRGCAGTPSPSGEPSSALQSWMFDLVILSFNLADFLGKSARRSLQWGTRVLSPTAQLALAALRAVLFTPLILSASAPQMYPAEIARWVIWLSVFALGLSNGWLSTVCFMRAPKALPPGTSNAVAEQASTILVIGLFLGISSGCLISYQLGRTVLHDHLGVCYGQ